MRDVARLWMRHVVKLELRIIAKPRNNGRAAPAVRLISCDVFPISRPLPCQVLYVTWKNKSDSIPPAACPPTQPHSRVTRLSAFRSKLPNFLSRSRHKCRDCTVKPSISVVNWFLKNPADNETTDTEVLNSLWGNRRTEHQTNFLCKQHKKLDTFNDGSLNTYTFHTHRHI
jgi:hypothetical protein